MASVRRNPSLCLYLMPRVPGSPTQLVSGWALDAESDPVVGFMTFVPDQEALGGQASRTAQPPCFSQPSGTSRRVVQLALLPSQLLKASDTE